MRILYAGDGPVGGAANYLCCILKAMDVSFDHFAPFEVLKPNHLNQPYDVIVLSDFPRKNLPVASEAAVVRQVEQGAGILMIGGWASFTGASGGWRGSKIEEILPVRCQKKDDRLNFPGGAIVIKEQSHPMIQKISFNEPPIICGMNSFIPKKDSKVILAARKIIFGKVGTEKKFNLTLGSKIHPLLVVSGDPYIRSAALATDLCPHWCGGLVDWGEKRLELRLNQKIYIEVGQRYVEFVSSMIRWLGAKFNSTPDHYHSKEKD